MKIKDFVLVCLVVVLLLFINRDFHRIDALESQVEYTLKANQKLRDKNEELRDKLTESELNYCTLSTYYYNEAKSSYRNSQRVEELESLVSYFNEVKPIPFAYTPEEVYLISSCASAEAGSLNYESQKAIAQVIVNRKNNPKFPNSIEDIIYQDGQFEVVENGAIRKPVSVETVLNVLEVLEYGYDIPKDILYFRSDKSGVRNAYICIEGTAFLRK